MASGQHWNVLYNVVEEVQTIMEETGFKERLRAVREGACQADRDVSF